MVSHGDHIGRGEVRALRIVTRNVDQVFSPVGHHAHTNAKRCSLTLRCRDAKPATGRDRPASSSHHQGQTAPSCRTTSWRSAPNPNSHRRWRSRGAAVQQPSHDHQPRASSASWSGFLGGSGPWRPHDCARRERVSGEQRRCSSGMLINTRSARRRGDPVRAGESQRRRDDVPQRALHPLPWRYHQSAVETKRYVES